MKTLYQKNHKCLDWMFHKGCNNMQSKEADNGLCEQCEKERRMVITKQLENIAKNFGK